VNTALNGCKSWTLTASLQCRITAFYHKAIRKILGITMYHVKDLNTSKMDYPSQTLSTSLDADSSTNLANSPASQNKKNRKFLTVWIPQPRRFGCLCMTLHHSYVDSLQHILGGDVWGDDSIFGHYHEYSVFHTI